MLLPPKALRAEFLAAMHDALDEPNLKDIRNAFVPVSAFYRVPNPPWRWLRGNMLRTNYGLTRYDNRDDHREAFIALTHPRDLARQRKWKKYGMTATEFLIWTALHEFKHWLDIPRAEAKCDEFGRVFMERVEV